MSQDQPPGESEIRSAFGAYFHANAWVRHIPVGRASAGPPVGHPNLRDAGSGPFRGNRPGRHGGTIVGSGLAEAVCRFLRRAPRLSSPVGL
jgi:hypothetical protein